MKKKVLEALEVFVTVPQGGIPRIWQVQTDGTMREVTEEYNRATIKAHVDNRKH